jgi:hypothetical protein
MPAPIHPKSELSRFRRRNRANRQTGFINFVTNTFKRFTQKNPAKIYIVDNNKENFIGLGKKTRKRRPRKK